MTKKSFRQSKIWKEFRKSKMSKQKVDCLTGSKLTKGCHCHHMDLRDDNYYTLTEENFVMANSKSHDVIHLCYSSKCGWKQYLKNLEKIMIKMEEINNGTI